MHGHVRSFLTVTKVILSRLLVRLDCLHQIQPEAHEMNLQIKVGRIVFYVVALFSTILASGAGDCW